MKIVSWVLIKVPKVLYETEVFAVFQVAESYSRKARHACGMSKNGQVLVYLGRIKNDSSLKSMKIWSFRDVKMQIKIEKVLYLALYVVTSCNKYLKEALRSEIRSGCF